MSTQQIITHTLLVDYLRLATWDSQEYLALLPKIRIRRDGWSGRRWQQYSGHQSEDGLFYGLGDQAGRAHFIIHQSGALASNLFTWLATISQVDRLDFYCTRIDLQITIPHPKGFDFKRAHRALAGRKTLILGDDGNTLYSGARTSDTFWRVYEKTPDLLRVELEAKGRQARKIWMAIVDGQKLAEIWNHYLLASKLPKVIVDAYTLPDDVAEMPHIVEQPDMDGKLAWLTGLDSLVYKLLADHDTGERARELIRRWSEYGQNLDKLS